MKKKWTTHLHQWITNIIIDGLRIRILVIRIVKRKHLTWRGMIWRVLQCNGTILDMNNILYRKNFRFFSFKFLYMTTMKLGCPYLAFHIQFLPIHWPTSYNYLYILTTHFHCVEAVTTTNFFHQLFKHWKLTNKFPTFYMQIQLKKQLAFSNWLENIIAHWSKKRIM